MPLAFNRHGVHYDSFWGATIPTSLIALSVYTWIGALYNIGVPGRIVGCRARVVAGSPFPRFAAMWEDGTSKYLGVTRLYPASPAADKWVQAYFRPMIRVNVSVWYAIAIQLNGGYFRTTGGASATPTHSNIQVEHGFQTTSSSPIDASPAVNANANGVDFLFYPD